MDFFDSLGRFDQLHQRGIAGGGGTAGHPSLRYPSPFFDIAHTYLPITIKHTMKWCSYYYLTNPIINPIVTNLAEYPITPIIVDEVEEKVKLKWENLIENQFNLRSFLIEVGLDYFTYGNAFISIHFPFHKYLICSICGHKDKIENCKYKYRGLKYRLECKKCGQIENARIKDEYIKSIKDIKLIRWNPENIDIEHVHAIGKTEYFLTIPQSDKNDILLGKKHVIEKLPHIYIEAIRQQKRIKFTDGEVFHFRRPIISQKDYGWGMPLILPALKSCYYVQILRKAQEAIMHGCIVPLRVIFPQGGDSQSSPYLNVNLQNWARVMQKELEKWRLDPNYIPIMPLPLGNEIVGGEGKSLTLFQELELAGAEVCNAMGVPLEFLKGGLSWSGSNMSLKLLENKFLSYRNRQLQLCQDFILGRIADYMEWNRPKISFKGFKMADDLQRSALLLQLSQAMKISDETLLDSMDLDQRKEQAKMRSEMNTQIQTQRRLQKSQANMQGEAAIVQAKYQALAQKKQMEMGLAPNQDSGGQAQQQGGGAEAQAGGSVAAPGQGQADQQPSQGEQVAQGVPGMPEGTSVTPDNAQNQAESGVPITMQSPINRQQQMSLDPQTGMSINLDIGYLAREAKNVVEQMDPISRQTELNKMKMENMPLYKAVNDMIQAGKGSQTDPLNPLQMPMPKIKPPRRAG